jgi:hypothetical protein
MAQATQAKPFLYAVANEHRIERTTDTKSGREEIRFSSGSETNGKSATSLVVLAEDEFLAMLRAAIERKVFTPKFLDGLRKVLGDRRVSRPPPADGPRW